MKAWKSGFVFILVLNAAVCYVTTLEGELADSISGEFPVKALSLTHTSARTHMHTNVGFYMDELMCAWSLKKFQTSRITITLLISCNLNLTCNQSCVCCSWLQDFFILSTPAPSALQSTTYLSLSSLYSEASVYIFSAPSTESGQLTSRGPLKRCPYYSLWARSNKAPGSHGAASHRMNSCNLWQLKFSKGGLRAAGIIGFSPSDIPAHLARTWHQIPALNSALSWVFFSLLPKQTLFQATSWTQSKTCSTTGMTATKLLPDSPSGNLPIQTMTSATSFLAEPTPWPPAPSTAPPEPFWLSTDGRWVENF